MTRSISAEERDELELLLPWYVNGTLPAEYRARIDGALAHDERLRLALDLAHEESGATEEMLAALGVPDGAVLDRIQRETAGGAAVRSAGWWQRAADRLMELVPTLPRPAMAAAGAAAFLLVAAQGMTIGWLLWKASLPSGVELAEGGGSDELSFRLIVKFSDTASMADVTRLLEELSLVVVDGPSGGGLFVVGRRADEEGLPEGEVLQAMQARSNLVGFVNRVED